MKGRVGHSITVGLLLIGAVLLLLITGCQRAKPARVVTPPPVAPHVETPGIARVAEVAATATANGAMAYPAPADALPVTPAAADPQAAYPPPAGLQAAYPPPAAPLTPVTPEPTEPPTAAPSPLPTEEPLATLVAVVTPTEMPPTPIPVVLYRVKAGDSLGSIAVLYNTTSAAIMARNGLRDPSLIRVGQTLIIPVANAETIPWGSILQHAVRSGETLDDIARYYRTTVDAVLAQNPTLNDPTRLSEGMVLTLIVGSQYAGRTHVVRPGESLGLIAERYGVTSQALARANGLTDPSLIRVGQTLIIP